MCLLSWKRFGAPDNLPAPHDRSGRQRRDRSRDIADQVIAVGAATVAAAPETDATW